MADIQVKAHQIEAPNQNDLGLETLLDKIFDSAGAPVNQVGFLAFANAQVTNQTGNGAVADVAFNTEVFDTGADFATPNFTAPHTGHYLLNTQVALSNITATTADTITLKIVTSNRTYEKSITHTNNIPEAAVIDMTVVADMDASDTAKVTIAVTGEAGDTVTVEGHATDLRTWFSAKAI